MAGDMTYPLVTCGYCRKTMRNRRFLGTWHFCLPPEEVAKIEEGRAAVRAQSAYMHRRILCDEITALRDPYSRSHYGLR